MNKSVYLLGLTLLCGFQARAEEVQLPIAETLLQESNIPADIVSSETPAPLEEDQTIFFSDDLLDEVDEELKAPIFTAPKENTRPQAPAVPSVKIPEDVKTPEPQTVSVPQTEAMPSEVPPVVLPQENENNTETNTEETPTAENSLVTETKVIQAAAPEPVAPVLSQTTAEDDLPAQNNESQAADEIPVAPQEAFIEEPEATEIATQQNAVVEADENNYEAPAVKEVVETKENPSVLEAEDIQPKQPVVPVQTEQEKSTVKKNSFSLDESALLQSQPQNNSYSLDSSAISSSFLKNDALSPSVLNRSIVNISPEQRAKMMMKKKYDEMDANQDGMVSEAEFVEYKTKEARKIAHQVFKQIDRNDDKMLSQYEYGLLMDKMIENYIKQPQKK